MEFLFSLLYYSFREPQRFQKGGIHIEELPVIRIGGETG